MRPDSKTATRVPSGSQPAAGSSPSPPFWSGRIPELDGVRGVAILLVLIWHYAASRLHPEPGSALAMVKSLFSMSWSGVDLFFVLSGFLIGGVLLDDRHSPNYFKTFYVRRVCRIFPLYYLLVLAFFAAAALGLSNRSGEFKWLFADPMPFWSYATFTQNFLMADAGRFGANGLGVTWSLAVEEQFYLLFPMIIRWTPKRALPWVLLMCAASAPAFRTWMSWQYRLTLAPGHLLMPSRVDALTLGVLAACAIRSTTVWRNLADNRGMLLGYFGILLTGVIVMSFAMPGFDTPHMNWWGRSWLALFYFFFVLLPVVKPQGIAARLLRFGLLRKLGIISYGVYLLHQPVLGLTYALVFHNHGQLTTAAHVLATSLALALTISLAAALYQFLEKPVLKFGHAHKY